MRQQLNIARSAVSAENRPPRDLEVLIPAFNEASRLPATLDALQAYLSQLAMDSAIVVVDNGSVDRTVGIAYQAQTSGHKVPVYVLGCAEQGKGAAVRRGVHTSRATYVGFQDADLSTPLDTLGPILDALSQGADVAIAVRRGGGSIDGNREFVRRLGSVAFSTLAGALTGVEDSQCGFKFFRNAAARAVFSQARIDGFAFDVEVLNIARSLGLQVAEVPVHWTPADGSTFRPLRDGVRSFYDVVRVPRAGTVDKTSSLRLNDLRVVFVNWRGIEHPEAGGAEKYAWELATRTAASGARTTYLTAASPGSPGRETIDGVEVVRRGSTLSVYPAALAWLARHRRSVDVVIDCQNGIPFFSPLVVGKSRAVILVVHHVHQEQFATRFAPRMAAIGRALEGPVSRVVYRRHTVVAVSPSTRHGIRRRLSLPGPVVIVPNGTPEIALRDAPRAPVPTILCLGRLVPHKRVDHLVQACATLRHRFPNLRVDIVGDGPARSELGKLVADLGLGDVVRLHGRVDEAKKARLLSEAWLAVNPSMSEGWGITVMEAAAAGVPSLAYDVAGLRDSILDGETGWLIPEGSDLGGGLAQALAGLLNPRSAAQWSARAQAWASCFTWDDSAARLAGVILDEAGRARRRASTAPERRRTDAACVLEVDGIDPAQVAALRRTLRRSDVVVTDGNRVLVLMYGCDERNGHLAAERAGLTGRVRVRVAQQRDFLTLQDHSVPDWPFEVPA